MVSVDCQYIWLIDILSDGRIYFFLGGGEKPCIQCGHMHSIRINIVTQIICVDLNVDNGGVVCHALLRYSQAVLTF